MFKKIKKIFAYLFMFSVGFGIFYYFSTQIDLGLSKIANLMLVSITAIIWASIGIIGGNIDDKKEKLSNNKGLLKNTIRNFVHQDR